MKKGILGLILLIGTVCSYAQKTDFKPELSVGVNGGVTLSNMRFVFYIPQSTLLQGQGGITVRYIAEKNFGLQAELNYSLRGWREQIDDIRINKYARSIRYLEFPLLTHIYYTMGKRFRGLFHIGPQVSYYLGESTIEREVYAPDSPILFNGGNRVTVTTGNTEISYKGIPSYYSQKIQRKFDYGITGGAGFELRTGIGSFALEGRYYFGLSDIFNNELADYFQASSHQVISIKLSFLYHIR